MRFTKLSCLPRARQRFRASQTRVRGLLFVQAARCGVVALYVEHRGGGHLIQALYRSKMAIHVMTKRFFALFFVVLLTGCAPPWSLKLHSFGAESSSGPHVVDARSEESKKFRFNDFAKLSYQSYLGDSNTTPARLQALSIRASASGFTSSDRIEISRFDILHDTSGSACRSCALAAVSYSGAVAGDSARQPGDNSLTCDIEGKLNGKPFHAQAFASYHSGAFDGPASDAFAHAADVCVSHVIDTWLSGARKL